MKKNQFGKLVKQPLLIGGKAVCLLFSLTLLAGGVAFAAPEVQPTPTPAEAPVAQNLAAAPVEQNQSAEELAAIEEENGKVSEALEKLLESMQMGTFEYLVEERPDPFMPFISEKIVQTTDPESGEKLSGMRQLEPGQLSLTAILFTEVNPIAMVEDSSHKGYIIRRGTRIGKAGIVTDILPNAVIIKVQSSYSTQEQKYTTVEMILRKEGEK